MLPALQFAKALWWHCLCPFKRQSLRALTRTSRPIGAFQQSRQKFSLNRAPKDSAVDKARSSTPSAGQAGLRISFAAKPPEQKHHVLRQAITGASSAELYRELDRRAVEGNIEWIQYLIQVLISERAEKPDHRHYLALILANTSIEHGSADEVKRLLDEVSSVGIPFDSAICHAVLKVLAIHPDYVLRAVIIEEMKRQWFSLTDAGWHYLIAGLLRDRQLELALERFSEMQTLTVRAESWLLQLLIYTCLSASAFPEAHALLDLRASISTSENPIPSAFWSHILSASASALYHPLISYIWGRAVKLSYLNPSTGTCTTVLESCARHGDYHLATDVIHALSQRSSPVAMHLYESLLETYLTSSLLAEALSVLAIMQTTPHPPTDATARPLYLYLREHADDPSQALSILEKRHSLQEPAPIPALNAIIEAYVFRKDLSAAVSIYKTIHTLNPSGPTTYTFNALFRGCAPDSRKDTAMFLAAEMRALGVSPDALTYDRLMLTCLNGSTREDVRDAWRYMEEMSGKGWWPRRGTVLALLRKACGFGDEKVWGLLGECEARGMDMIATRRWVEEAWVGPRGEKEIPERDE